MHSFFKRAFNTKYWKKYITIFDQIHPFWKISKLVMVVVMVIVINYVIGGLSWVHLTWLADVTVRFQVPDFTVRFQP